MQTRIRQSSQSLAYRADIDGLRAIAVLSVVVYHALSQILPGGFVGVDIFFVISGYLITSIVIGDVRKGGFSLAIFYERRIRRIVPALIVVVLATLVAGYFLLTPGDYRELGNSAVWTIGFIANFFFWLNTGYFDAARETMPLLHMWSLAVEEQFYLVWPLLAAMLVRWLTKQPRTVWFVLVVAFSTSLAASIVLTETAPQTAFYLPATRAWELGLGALLALFKKEWLEATWADGLARVMSWAGLFLIIYAVTQLDSSQPFPGYNALYPVLGAAALIYSGTVRQGIVARFLSISPMVFFGKISYSLYLWHWPIFVFFRHYTNGDVMTVTEAFSLIALSVVFATLSWKFVEQPLRYARVTRGSVFTAGAAASILAVVLGLGIVSSNGMPSRVPDEALKLADHKTMWSWPCPAKYKFANVSRKRCVLGESWDSATKHAVLWGDSHALHYAPLVDRVARRLGYSVFLFDSCPPYLDNVSVRRHRANQAAYSQECGSEYQEITAFLAQDNQVDLIMLASAWATYPKHIHGPDEKRSLETGLRLMESGMSTLVEQFASDHRRMLLFTEVPRSGENLVPCVLSTISGVLRRTCATDPDRLRVHEVQEVHGATNAVLYALGEKHEHVSIVDATSRMCGEEFCETHINGEFVYRDTNHLRRNLEPKTMDELIRLIGIDVALAADGVGFDAAGS